MNTRAIITLAITLSAGVVCFAQGPKQEEKSGPVRITDLCVVIPGTQISPKDQEDVKAILHKYDNQLYKIQRYENGTLKETLGKMEVRKEIATDAAAWVKKAGLSNWTTQIGFCEPYHSKSCGTGCSCLFDSKSNNDLVAEVSKILNKYK